MANDYPRGPGRPPKGESIADLMRAAQPFDVQVARYERDLCYRLIGKLIDMEEPGDPANVEAVRQVAARLGKLHNEAADYLAALTREKQERAAREGGS
jgi:hypothetical protein